MLNTVWDDGGSALFSRDWYGVAFSADQSWQSAPDDALDFALNDAEMHAEIRAYLEQRLQEG